MNIFTNYLEKLGSNFLVSAMIPALALVITSMIVFDPILNVSGLFASTNSIFQMIGFGLLLAVPAIILGYTLTALNTYIIKIFEGYVLLHRFPRMRSRQLNQAHLLFSKREAIRKRIEVIERRKINHGGRLDGILARLRKRYFVVAAEYDNNYPPTLEHVLPTKFGNVLKASESYPMTRYGLDGVVFWPRLLHVIPPQYQAYIDSSRNELSFLVNISILSTLFFFLCALAIIIGPAFTKATPTDFLFTFPLRYGLSGFIALFNGWVFYKASLYSIGDFGGMVRSAYDLFRLDLLKQFHIKMPATSVDEYKMWQNLNEFVILGAESLEFSPLKYKHPQTSENSQK